MLKGKSPSPKRDPVSILALKSTEYIGSPVSLILHTLFFVGIFLLGFVGVSLDKILLILTTVVSLEAIYLAIFIQMSVNQQALQLQAVSQEVDEIGTDVDEISRDIDEIQEEVEDLAEEVEEIGEDIEEDDREDEIAHQANVERIEKIEFLLSDLLKEMKKK